VKVPADGDISQWHLVAERIVENNGWGTADQYSYHVPIVLRGFKQSHYVSAVAACLWERRHLDERRYVVGHSNGCAIILAALAENPELTADEIHLFGAAVSGNYDENGLNALMNTGQVGRVVWYCSTSDWALKWAKGTAWIRWVAARWAYGYGGLSGPSGMMGAAVFGTRHEFYKGFGHGTYFQDGRLTKFIRGMVNGTPPTAEDLEAPIAA
jgi:pimeloyl-ACP methyl ester carboxylesterase